MRRPITMDMASLSRWTDLWLNRGGVQGGIRWLGKGEMRRQRTEAALQEDKEIARWIRENPVSAILEDRRFEAATHRVVLRERG